MFNRIPMPGPFTVLLVVALLACGTAGVAAAELQTVTNGAEPARGLETADLTELWRAGGEDDEIFFGSVASVRTDREGNILLLDGQLSEVHVISPQGEFLRTVCREGDGPGEVRQPNDMFVTADGTICVLQGFPGRIVKLTSDGLPAGEAGYSHQEGDQGQFAVLNRGFALPEGILLVGIRMSFGGAISNQTYFLSLCSDDGIEKTALWEKQHTIDYSDFELTEKAMDFVWNRVAVGPEGNIFAAPERNLYEIRVFNPEGRAIRTITREYQQKPRGDQDNKTAYQIIEAVGAYYPTPPKRIAIEDTAPAIGGMWVTKDGRLWIQPGDAHLAVPAGGWLVLDVFTPDGAFEKQVVLPGRYNGRQDALFMQPDGLVIVVVGALDAFLNQQAVSSEEGGGESTSQPLEVICYRMGP